MKQVTYNNKLRYQLNRPHATVQLVNGAKRTAFSFGNCLVDTGADHTILPLRAAQIVGLTIPPGLTPVATLGGPVNVYQTPNCEVDIEGILIQNVTVLFDPSGKIPHVVGMDVLKALSDFGFNQLEWLWA